MGDELYNSHVTEDLGIINPLKGCPWAYPQLRVGLPMHKVTVLSLRFRTLLSCKIVPKLFHRAGQ